jgi:hypothetical protein
LSRRKRRARGAPAAPGDGEPADRRGRAPGGQPGGRPPGAAGTGRPAPSHAARASSRGVVLDVAVLIAVFAVTAGIAGLAGAANLGVALGVGQVAFAIALVVLLLRG